MTKGAQECDEDGRNCRSVFDADDTPDYVTLKFRGQATTGVESHSFQTEGNDSGSIATQMGTLALACGDIKVKTVSGTALKALCCVVNPDGNARVTVQVCTAPARGNPVSRPENGVECSTNPSEPNFTAPAGKVCLREACDTQPLNSLNGWSSPRDGVWNSTMSEAAPEAERSNNGLGLIFYSNPAQRMHAVIATLFQHLRVQSQRHDARSLELPKSVSCRKPDARNAGLCRSAGQRRRKLRRTVPECVTALFGSQR